MCSYLQADLQAALVPGLRYDISSWKNGLRFTVGGYNEKLHLMVDIISQGITNFLSNINAKNFEDAKRNIRNEYYYEITCPRSLNR